MDKEKDIFNEIIKNKLSNYSLPVDDDSWDKIEERLNSAPGKKTKQLWITTIAVAASIALLFLLFPLNKKVYHHETANQLSDHEKEIVQDVFEKETVQSDLQQNVRHSTVFRKSQPVKRLAKNELTVEVISKDEISEENQVVPAIEEPSVKGNPAAPRVFDFDFGKDEKTPVVKHKKRQSVSLSLGSGGNLLASNNTAVMQRTSHAPGIGSLNSSSTYYRATNQDIVQTRTEDILADVNYSDVIHYPPISVGITVKKELNRTVAIESGIMYSYIITTFSGESSYRSKADLQLHYIGVPLNIITHLYRDRKSPWEVYLSAGGMVEKGILSRFVQKTFFDDIDNTVMTVTSNEKIKGLQWSVGISPGIDYKIYKNYSIYLEPKLSYYFDNDQPESARTKHPVVVGVNAGIRFAW